jgi:hypothetical protein
MRGAVLLLVHEEVAMRFMLFQGPDSRQPGRGGALRAWLCQWALPGAAAIGMLAIVGYAQNQTQLNPEKSIILPEANRLPDANDQMKMRENQNRTKNFDAANAERLKQMMQASEMLETMAIALKAEVDNSSSGTLSPEVLRKAEVIEKLARIVKDRMKMTVLPN